MKKIRSVILLLLLSLGAVESSYAATDDFIAPISRILLSADGTWGGCMVFLRGTDVASTGLDCPRKGWVSLGCTGNFAPKDATKRMLDNASLAFALNKQVSVRVDDTKKESGFCSATRINVF